MDSPPFFFSLPFLFAFCEVVQGSNETWLHCVFTCARCCARIASLCGKNTVVYTAISCTFPSFALGAPTLKHCVGSLLTAHSFWGSTVKDTAGDWVQWRRSQLTEAVWQIQLHSSLSQNISNDVICVLSLLKSWGVCLTVTQLQKWFSRPRQAFLHNSCTPASVCECASVFVCKPVTCGHMVQSWPILGRQRDEESRSREGGRCIVLHQILAKEKCLSPLQTELTLAQQAHLETTALCITLWSI